MKKIIYTISLFLVYFIVSSQTCADIQDICHRDCKVIDTANGCKNCNYPQWKCMKSWYDGEVVEFTTVGRNKFLRFISGNREGSWMVKPTDVCVDGKIASFGEVREILQLQDMPDAILIVNVPEGTVMLEGRIYGSTCYSCRQFCVKDYLDKDCFTSFTCETLSCSYIEKYLTSISQDFE